MSFPRQLCALYPVIMGKQMVLAVFIISVALRAEAKLEVISVKLGPATDRAFVLGYPAVGRGITGSFRLCLFFKLRSPVNLSRRKPLNIVGPQKEQDEIKERSNNGNLDGHFSGKKAY